MHQKVSNAQFGAEFTWALFDIGWPNRETNPIGLYYSYNVDVGHTNPSVLELMACEKLRDIVMAVDSKQLHVGQKELANDSNAEADLVS